MACFNSSFNQSTVASFTITMEKIFFIPLFYKITGFTILPLLVLFYARGVEASIGVNYGTMADDLPPPKTVVRFLQHSTVINRVRLYNADPQMLKAFTGTKIAVTVTIPNDQIPYFTNFTFALKWVEHNIVPHIHKTNIVRILVGNEVLSTANKLLISSLVPAMQTLHTALAAREPLDQKIKISTAHSLGILSNSSPPSAGKFRQGYDAYVLKPLLNFLKATNSPFMVNPYPFFAATGDNLDYVLFRGRIGILDENTNLTYTNMLDEQLDAVFSAIKRLEFTDIDIVIAETGWPSRGDVGQVGVDVETAGEFNMKLVRHVTSGIGTPLMPNTTFETYIFALFNEDLKPGPICERNFGLFEPNLTMVYDVGILKPVANDAKKIQRIIVGDFFVYVVIGLLLKYLG